MIIKTNKKKKFFFNNFYKIYFFLSLFIISFTFLIFFQLNVWDNYKEELKKRLALNGMSNYVYLPKILNIVLKNIFSNLEDEVVLNINQKNILVIENNRKEKLNDFKVGWKKAKANLIENNERIDVEVRLKGDRKIHYESKNYSSYKINVSQNKTFKNLESFSIQKPRIRNYVNEWIFHKMADELGLINLDYKFINFIFNGENMGLYVLEEGFGNNLLEKNKRRAGPIFGLDETFQSTFSKSRNKEIKLDPYQLNYWLRPENKDLLLIAKDKLNKFFKGEINAKEVIDFEKWSSYFVLCDLLETGHGYVPKSVKFYYNPISGLFEPIAFDGHKMPAYNPSPILDKYKLYDHRTSLIIANNNENNLNIGTSDYIIDWLRLFFFDLDNNLNNQFFKNYQTSLNKIVNHKFLDNFFEKYEKEIDKYNAKIYLDLNFQFDYHTERKKGLGIYFFDKNRLYNRVDKIKSLNTINLNKISLEDYKNQIIIDNRELSNNKLLLTKIKCENNEFNINKEIKLQKTFIKKNEFSIGNLNCNTAIFEDYSKKIYSKKINQNFKKENMIISLDSYKKFFVIKNDTLSLIDNDTIINENIKIPKGYKVVIFPGQKITLINNAFIFSNSNFFIKGTVKNPVKITGLENNFGGGLFVNSENENIIKNLKLSNLAGPDIFNNFNQGFIKKKKIGNINKYFYEFVDQKKYSNQLNNYRIYGALNFYKTVVKIQNLDFEFISAEDALNIIESEFQINNISFKNIASDAIDIDFGQGYISNTYLKDIGNDALDFSGSKVNIENVNSNNVGDKVISSGENSEIKIKNFNAKNSYIGIANKDGSKLFAEKIVIEDTYISFAAYLKKNIYNESEMNINNFELENSDIKYLLSKKANLKLDNQKQKTNISIDKINKVIYRQNKSLLN